MKFRTEVSVPKAPFEIEKTDKIFTIGSCFSIETEEFLRAGQLRTMSNPFGTLFNSFSIAAAIEKIHHNYLYGADDLITYNNEFLSLEHHTSFNRNYAHHTLEKINANIDEANAFVQDARIVIITLGTAFYHYFLPKDKIAANCHKIPARHFEKKIFSVAKVEDHLQKIAGLIRDIAPAGVQMVFSVSPVRHTKDGIEENMMSKATLLVAVKNFCTSTPDAHYFPAYEIMMDDLRDYRFYTEDLIHPSRQAVTYIMEKFGTAYFSSDCADFVEENFKILTGLRHRTSNPESREHHNFLEKLAERIQRQQLRVPFPIFA